jgi:hypothetical protein
MFNFSGLPEKLNIQQRLPRLEEEETPMRILRWIGIALAMLIFVLFAVAMIARESDGPLHLYPFAFLPGGPLKSGELVTGPEPDWSFTRDVMVVELQLANPPLSRNTWLVVHEGKLYVPCGYMNSWWGRLWKQWPVDAMHDGRAMIRIAGRRYVREAVRVTEPDLFWSLIRVLRKKYRPLEDQELPEELPSVESTGVWFFELAPRGSAATRTRSSPGR